MKKYTLYLAIILLALLLLSLLPIFPNNSSLLKKCRFDEFTGSYDKCFWIWDSSRNAPSIYF